jgi:predicted small metal-binding protein
MDGDPAKLLADPLALACVNACPNRQADLVHTLDDRRSRANGLSGRVERRQEPIARGIELDPGETLQLSTYGGVVAREQLAPAPVTEHGGTLTRADDVREKDGGEDCPGHLASSMHRRQGFAKVAAAESHDSTEGGPVARVINCECGQEVRAETDDELVERVEEHVRDAHPDLAGKMSREDILAMAEAE